MTLHYEMITVTPFRQNCTLLWDGETREAVLIDACDDVPVLEEVAKRGLKLTEV